MHKRIAIITAIFCLFSLSCPYATAKSIQHYIPLNEYASRAEELISEGDYAQALEMYGKALTLYEKNNFTYGILYCLERMGWYKRELGEYAEALELFQKAKPLGVREFGDAADIDADMGNIYMFSGDSVKAEEYYWRALNTLENFKFKTTYDSRLSDREMLSMFRKCKVIIHARCSLGMLNYFAGKYEKALSHLVIADKLIERIFGVAKSPQYGQFFKVTSEVYEAVGYCQTIMAAVYGELGQFDKARTYFSKGKEAFENGDRHFGALFNRALKLKTEFKAPGIPIDITKFNECNRLIEEADRFGATEIVWRTKYEVGRALKKFNRYPEASSYLAGAIETLELTRSRLKEDTFKKMFVASTQDVYSEMIDLLLAVNDAEESFNYLERSRARAFLDILAGRSPKAKKSVDPALIEKEKEVNQKIELILRKLAAAGGAKKKDIYGEYKNLLSEHKEILESIKKQSLDFASTASVTTIPVKKISAGLKENDALISYFLGEKRMTIWVVRQDLIAAISVDADADTLTGLAIDYRQAVAKNDAAHISELGMKLYNFLIAPVRDKLSKTERLFIVPSKALHYLPFSSLPGPGQRFLVEDFAISIIPNASCLFFLDKVVSTDRERILAVGNPQRKEAGLALKFAEDEVKIISRNFSKSVVLTGKDATESFFKKKDIIDTGIIHIAAHGIYYVDDPLKSAILLAEDEEDDGNLETFEIFALTMNPRLVVLSACQSGIGEVESGDEIQSLNRAFLYAGAGAVMASLWNVDDKATAVLMEKFYKYLEKTGNAQALRLAQTELVKNPTYKSPYYWAAFYLVGGLN